MKARAEADSPSARASPTASSSAGAAASATSSSRCSCSSSCTGATTTSVRSPNDARRARTSSPTAGTSNAADADRLDDAYRFLRTVEHRLQLYDEQQTHTLPSDERRATRLARVLGYRDSAERDRARALRRRAPRPPGARCASIHERLFFAPLLETLAGAGPLVARGGRGAPRRVRLHRRRARPAPRSASSTQGLTRRSRLMQQLLPVILELALRDPRSRPRPAPAAPPRRGPGPVGVARRRRSATRRAPPSARVTLLGSSRVLGDALRRQPEFVDALGDDDAARARGDARPSSSTTRSRRSSGAATHEPRREGLRRFKRRELLRIAARDLLGFARLEVDRARARRRSPRRASKPRSSRLEPPLPFAVIGMGRLGGGELSYASDIDVLFVYDGDGAADFDARRARRRRSSSQEIGATTAEGQTFRIDAGLRPEGKQGPLARSLDGLPRRTTSGGASPGSSRRSSRRGSSPATRELGATLLRARRRRSSTASRSPRTTCARSGA